MKHLRPSQHAPKARRHRFSEGQRVETPHGVGVVEWVASDGTVGVRLDDNWAFTTAFTPSQCRRAI